jgi:signal transduction histidine kinase
LTWFFTPISFTYLIAACICFYSAQVNMRFRRENTGIQSLSWVLLSLGVTLLAGFLELAAVEPGSKYTFLLIENTFITIYTILMVRFVVRYLDAWPWLRRRPLWMWMPAAVDITISLTDRWHHLYWISLGPTDPATNLVVYNHGPLFAFSNVIFNLLLVIVMLRLLYQGITGRGRERRTSIYIAAALAIPLVTYAAFLSLADPVTATVIYATGFIFSALLIDWAAAEEMSEQIALKTTSLEGTVQSLNREIDRRAQLEQQLRTVQASLADHLAAQSAKLARLYDLILLGGSAGSPADLVRLSLDKINTSLNAGFCLYFEVDTPGRLRLAAYHGGGVDPANPPPPPPAAAPPTVSALPADWQPFAEELLALAPPAATAAQPAELYPLTDGAALVRWVSAGGRPLGLFAACWLGPHAFTVEETALFSAFADGLGVIFENTRLQAEAARDATLQERRRLARDLHDSVTQLLHSQALSAQTALDAVDDPVFLRKVLHRLDAGASQAVKEMRLLLYELRLAAFTENGLADMIALRLQAVEQRSGVAAELKISPGTVWPRAWDAQLYPLVMEALNNILKHARAARVSIEIRGADAGLQVEIRDDGVGFDPSEIRPGRIGLQNMAERCQALGAALEIQSAPNAGTLIRIRIPYTTAGALEMAPAAQELENG